MRSILDDDAVNLRQIIIKLTDTDHVSIAIEAPVDNKSVENEIYSTKSLDDKYLHIDTGSIKEILSKEKSQGSVDHGRKDDYICTHKG